nr:HYR domain-containing protein [Bacteroidia bacterium]
GTPVTVTLTATDLNGNTNTGTATVTVLDTVRPVVVTQNRTVYLNASGTATVSALQLNNGTSDACGVASLSASQTSYTCANVGVPVTVTLTATDLNGNTNTGTATVTVLDTVRPVVVTQNRTVYLNAAGTATVTAAQVNNGSSDACGVAALSLSQTSFTCANVGTPVTVTLTVTDVNGNSRTGTALITVLDTIRPIVVTQNRTVYLSAAGTATVSALQLNNGTNDACGVASLSASQTSYTCANVGTPVTVTLTATDLNGNTNTGTAVVTVLDSIRPVVVTQNRTIYLNASGTATISAALVNNGSSDACGVAALSLSRTSFNCANIGANSVTLTVTDVNGNSNTGSAIVTVLDTIKPVVICKSDTLILNASGTGSITFNDVLGSASDNCVVKTYSLSKSNFTAADIGLNNITLTATDSAGNSGTCVASLLVIEPKPVAICRNATIYLNGSGNATLSVDSIDNGSFSLVGLSARVLSKTNFNCTNLGTNNVWLRVTNSFNSSDSCLATVTVLDTVRPNVIAQNRTIYLNASGTASITSAEVNNNTTDNCTGLTLSLSKTSFNCTNLGSNTVRLTATDGSGNKDSVTATITVLDTIRPALQPRSNVVLFLGSNGTFPVTPNTFITGTTDNCATDSVWLSQNTLTCADLGVKNIDVFAKDASGNISAITVSAIVSDPVIPVARPKAKVTVYLSANGQAVINPSQVDSASTDNCTITSRLLSQTVFTCSQIGNNTVTFTVQDQSGNSAFVNTTIEVLDTIKPNVIVSNRTLYLSQTGTASLTASQVNNNSTDNCGIDSIWLSKTTFGCSETGNNTIQLIVRDIHGNQNSANVLVTVFDTIRPVLRTKQNIRIYTDANGNAQLTTSMVDSNSNDNCTLSGLTLSQTNFTSTQLGNNIITLSGTDASGNINTINFTVTVLDSIHPSLTAQNFTAYLNASGTATITATQLVTSSSDNSGTPTITLSRSSFGCLQRGSNSVVVTATDASNNSTSSTVTVTVLDTIRPVANASNLTVYLNASGTANITPAMANNGSTDNCSIQQIALSKTSFTSSDLGNQTVVLTVTDSSSNSSTASFTVTVIDTVRPIASAQNITIHLNASGSAVITPSMINNNSTDNAGSVNLSLNKTTFTCVDLGLNTVVLTVTDASNNSNTVLATVNVLDTIKPVATTRNITVHLNAIGQATITPAMINNGSTDNCTIGQLSLNTTLFTCANRGSNTVVLTVTDGSGNNSTANATVTVLDTIRPNVVVNNNLNLYLNNVGVTSLTTAQVNNGSSDNCGITSFSLGKTNFTATDLGLNIVSFTATDASGNSSTVNINVTVLDTVRPIAIAQNQIIYLDGSGAASLSASSVNNGSTDNVGVSNVSINKTNFTCSDRGVQQLVFTASDASANSSSVNFNVEVRDTIRPNVITQNRTVYLNGLGSASITAADINNGSTDNCSVTQLSLNATTFSCANIGTNNVTLTVTDASGNTRNGVAVVTVLDTLRPLASISNNINIYLNQAGSASLTAAQVNNGSTDNCSIATLSISKTTFNSSNLGANVITFTATDGSGNSTTVNVNVNVLDTVRPIVIAQNRTLYLNASGQAAVSVAQVNNGSSDNVGIANQNLSRTNFSCSDIGINSINYTVTDISGNSTTVQVSITVLDTIAPIVNNAPKSVVLGRCNANLVYGTPQIIDNCGQVNIEQLSGIQSGNTFPVGTTVNTFRVTDASGNSTTFSFSVTILPGYIPVTFKNIELCGNDAAFDLSQGADSLTFTGSGVINDAKTFDPRVSGPGNHVINYSFIDTTGCANTGFFFVTVYASPTTPVIERTTSSILKVRDVYDSYQWYRDNQPIPGETKQSINLTKIGVYYVVVKSNRGCTNVSEPIGIGVPIGVKQIDNKPEFAVYPNPNKGLFYIERSGNVTGTTLIVITDLTGRTIYQGSTEDDLTEIDLSMIAAGTYYIRLQQNESISIKPIVIKN